MSMFDESKHARDTGGRFAEMAGSEQTDALSAVSSKVRLPGVEEIELDIANLPELPAYPPHCRPHRWASS